MQTQGFCGSSFIVQDCNNNTNLFYMTLWSTIGSKNLLLLNRNQRVSIPSLFILFKSKEKSSKRQMLHLLLSTIWFPCLFSLLCWGWKTTLNGKMNVVIQCLLDAHTQEIEADILFCTMLTIKHYCLSSLQSNVRQRHLMLLGNNLEHLCRARKKVMGFRNWFDSRKSRGILGKEQVDEETSLMWSARAYQRLNLNSVISVLAHLKHFSDAQWGFCYEKKASNTSDKTLNAKR